MQEETMGKDSTITIKEAPEPRGPYVHARQHGGLVYVTAQIGRDPKTGDFVKGGFEAEFNQAIDNLEAILKAAGTTLGKVVKAQIEFVDEKDLDAMNRI
jgi:2-iminobutanoate/2-iminopropanoate deaminase